MRHPFLAGSSLGKHRATHSAVSARYYCSIVLALLGRWMLLRLYDITLGPRFEFRFRITYQVQYSTVPVQLLYHTYRPVLSKLLKLGSERSLK